MSVFQPVFSTTYINTSLPLNTSYKWFFRARIVGLTIGIALLQPLISIVNVAYRILKVGTLFDLWFNLLKPTKSGENYNLGGRLLNAGKGIGNDIRRIIVAPLVIIALEFAAILAIFNPNKGIDLYRTLENSEYGNTILSPNKTSYT